MFTWPSKTNFTTVPDPLELQILLEDQTATEILFQSYAATTTIDRMTWLACISHYVRGHVHKTGHNYNGTNRGARSIQPKFPEISVQNSMDRFGPTWNVSQKLVHLLRWSFFPGRTGLNFGWMDRARGFKPGLRARAAEGNERMVGKERAGSWKTKRPWRRGWGVYTSW